MFLSFDAHESVSGSSRRCNKCHEGWDVIDIAAPEGGFYVGGCRKNKSPYLFFKFLPLSAGCVRESGFINMKQMVEYHPLISVTTL